MAILGNTVSYQALREKGMIFRATEYPQPLLMLVGAQHLSKSGVFRYYNNLIIVLSSYPVLLSS